MEGSVSMTLGSLPCFLDISNTGVSEFPSPRVVHSTVVSPRKLDLPQIYAEKFGVKGNFLYENTRINVAAKLRRLASQGTNTRPHRKTHSGEAPATLAKPSVSSVPPTPEQVQRNKFLCVVFRMKTQHQLLRTVNKELEGELKCASDLQRAGDMFKHISNKMKHVRGVSESAQNESVLEAKTMVEFPSQQASKLCIRSEQEAWTKSHGLEVSKSHESMEAMAVAVYELAQTGSQAAVDTKKLLSTVIGIGVNLSPGLVLKVCVVKAISAFLQRDVSQNRVSQKEWVHFVVHETTISTFLERQRRNNTTRPKELGYRTGTKTRQKTAFNSGIQCMLQDFEHILGLISHWWQGANKRNSGSVSLSNVCQCLTDISCFSNPSEAAIHVRKLVGVQGHISRSEFTLVFVRGLIKLALGMLSKVLAARWTGSGMSLCFQLSLLKKNLILAGLKYGNSLIANTERSEALVNNLSETEDAVAPVKPRGVFVQYQEDRNRNKGLPAASPESVRMQTRKLVNLSQQRTASAGPVGGKKQLSRSGGKDRNSRDRVLFSQTLSEMQDVVSYIPDVNLFLVLSD